jgi:hypothetical protein
MASLSVTRRGSVYRVTFSEQTAARPEVVYDLLADLRTHIEWGGRLHPSGTQRLRSMEAPARPARAGVTFRSVGTSPAGTWHDRSRVTVAIRPTVFQFATKGSFRNSQGQEQMLLEAVHRYEIDPAAGGARVTYRLSAFMSVRTSGEQRHSRFEAITFNLLIPGVIERGIRNLLRMAEERVVNAAAKRSRDVPTRGAPRIFPGIGISVSPRGIGISGTLGSLSIEPGTDLITPFQTPSSVSTFLSAMRPRWAKRMSLAAYERESRMAVSEDDCEALLALQTGMTTVHRGDIPPARPISIPDPARVSDADVLSALLEERFLEERLSELPIWRLRLRRKARAQAAERARQEIAVERGRQESRWRQAQKDVTGVWRRLLANDPEVVLATIEHAFRDNAVPAAPIDCQDNGMTIAMLVECADALPATTPALSSDGIHRMTPWDARDRNAFFASYVASNAMVTVREVMSLAPSIQSATLVVIRKTPPAAEGRPQMIDAVFFGTFSRLCLRDLDWDAIDPVAAMQAATRARWSMDPSTLALLPIDLASAPQIGAILAKTAEALGCEWRGVTPHDGPSSSTIELLSQTGSHRSLAGRAGLDVESTTAGHRQTVGGTFQSFEDLLQDVDVVIENNLGRSPKELMSRADLKSVFEPLGLAPAEQLRFIEFRLRRRTPSGTPWNMTSTGDAPHIGPPSGRPPLERSGSMSGEEIYWRYNMTSQSPILMARLGGLHGNPLSSDLETGTWREFVYLVSQSDIDPPRNWFRVADFVARIEEPLHHRAGRSEPVDQDPRLVLGR